jgi:hypothetical protein
MEKFLEFLKGLFSSSIPTVEQPSVVQAASPVSEVDVPAVAEPDVPNPAPFPAVPSPTTILPEHEEEDRPHPDSLGAKILWYPNADCSLPAMKTHGKYRKGYPEGAIVHFTAGAPGLNSLSAGRQNGYCYMYIDRDGKIYQTAPLDSWGYHAGESYWKGLGNYVSRYLVGIELASAGDCVAVKGSSGTKYKAWFHTRPTQYFAESEIRKITKARDNMKPGNYQMYTKDQEASLISLLLWLKQNNPDVFSFDLVLGHDSVSPARKNDPGGALSMSIPELQALLKKRYESGK